MGTTHSHVCRDCDVAFDCPGDAGRDGLDVCTTFDGSCGVCA